jgi:uncharacterized protein (TIGR02145 family)
LISGVATNGVSVKVPYTGGIGGVHGGQVVTSNGVSGLTATLAAGNFVVGADSLIYTIAGTPSSGGTASFALNIGGQSCTLSLSVGIATPACWAKVSATDTLIFMCHNLASANTSADPFTPSWEIIGGYWQWGRKGPDASQWLNTNTPEFAHGPTGAGVGEANEAAISVWNQNHAPDGAWLDNTKTADDPCPAGYLVPTKAQWDAVIANNNQSIVGTWSTSSNYHTNYSAGRFFGPALILPTTGARGYQNGTLFIRGDDGNYWSRSEYGTVGAWGLNFDSGNASTFYASRVYGFSVRCAAENIVPSVGSISALNCTNVTQTGTLTAGTAATGVSVKVPYTGGNGGHHSGQTATSTGVTGLTATLTASNFANGADSLAYNISGTPVPSGIASFALSVGGQSCTLVLTVVAPAPGCWAKVSVTDTLYFMCRNLGSANTSADPFTPSWEINGGYWQWGRLGQAAPGPSSASQPNAGAISGWDTTNAPNGSWQDGMKTTNDPCPADYRVPTKAQWDALLVNNTQSIVGTWSTTSTNHTNYSTGRFFGPALMLPAAGGREYTDGTLFHRGRGGYYWSSTEVGSSNAWSLGFISGYASTSNYYERRYGFSVRCVAE